MGWAMAVLVEMVMPPFESVKVTNTATATGVAARVVTKAGEGLPTMLSDVGAGEFELTGSMSFAVSRTFGLASPAGGLDVGFAAGVVVIFGTISSAGESAIGANAGKYCQEERVSSGGAVVSFSGCACSEAGPLSDSVDVEVWVRYNAVYNTAGPAIAHIAERLQFATPRLGKRFSIRLPVPPHPTRGT